MQFNKIIDIARLINNGRTDCLREAIENHVSGNSQSPFLSTSMFPAVAQSFAGHTETGFKDSTIFELQVSADRLIHVGAGHYSENCNFTGFEVLILGSFFPEDFVSVKKSNLLEHSELLYVDPVFGHVVSDPVFNGFKNIRLPKIDPENWENV